MQRLSPGLQRPAKSKLPYRWVSVSYCPGALWFIEMYGAKDITRYVYASRHDAEKAKDFIDQLACGGGCQRWHTIELATPTERRNYPHIKIYHIERKDYHLHGLLIPVVYDNIDRALSRNVGHMSSYTDSFLSSHDISPSHNIETLSQKWSWKRIRFAILKRDNYRCRLCGISAKDGEHIRLEIDHITPKYLGGSNDLSNLWTLCFACNRGKGVEEL